MVTKPKYVTKRSMSQYDLSSAFRLSPVSVFFLANSRKKNKQNKNKSKNEYKTATTTKQQNDGLMNSKLFHMY